MDIQDVHYIAIEGPCSKVWTGGLWQTSTTSKQVHHLLHKIRIDCNNRMMCASLATLFAPNNLHEDFHKASDYSGYYGYFCNFVAENKNDHSTWTIVGAERRVEVRVVPG